MSQDVGSRTLVDILAFLSIAFEAFLAFTIVAAGCVLTRGEFRAIVFTFTFVNVFTNIARALVATLAITPEALGEVNAHLSGLIARINAFLALINKLKLAFIRCFAAAPIMFVAVTFVRARRVAALGVGAAMMRLLFAFVNLLAFSLAITPVSFLALASVAADLVSADGVLVADIFLRTFIDIIAFEAIASKTGFAFTSVLSLLVNAFGIDIALVNIPLTFVNVNADAIGFLVP